MAIRELDSGSVRRIFVRFMHHLRPHRRTLGYAALCMLGATAMELLRPWPLKIIFDVILVPQPGAGELFAFAPALADNLQLLLGAIALFILTIAIVGGLLGFGQSFLTASVGQKVVASIRSELYSHIQRLSHSFHDENATGDLIARLTGDIRMMREMLVTTIIYLSDRSLVVVGMFGIMLWMDWLLTLVAVAILPMLLLAIQRFNRRIKGATRKQRRKESQITCVMQEKLSAITVVQSYARAAYEDEQFARQNLKSMHAGVVTTRLEAQMNRVVMVILATGTAAVLWLGVLRVQAGILTPGDLLVFTAYLAGLYKPVRKLSSLTTRIAKASVCGERIISILDISPAIEDAPDAVEAAGLRGDIEFQGVSFGYQPKAPVLRDASFRINRGETVALVGKSGSGKSTIVSLLLRLYDPDQGSIRIDGRDIRAYTVVSLRDEIALVLQDSDLFNTTVADNIAYGKLDATRDEIVAAARAANAHAFIEAMPDGYDTVVGERGGTLSGGQRQRIAIARAMIRQAPIVILDEPMSGLDEKSRDEVQQGLDALIRDRTCLVITHDLAAAADADRILYVADGRVSDTAPARLVRGSRHAEQADSRSTSRAVRLRSV